MASNLYCSRCKRHVSVVAGAVLRACDCPAETAVVADLSAHATGESAVDSGIAKEPL